MALNLFALVGAMTPSAFLFAEISPIPNPGSSPKSGNVTPYTCSMSEKDPNQRLTGTSDMIESLTSIQSDLLHL